MSFTELLINSFVKGIPRINNLANRVRNNYNLIANYPLLLKPTSSNRLAIFSQGKITKGNDIILLSAGQCMFSSGLSGSTQSQQKQVQQQMVILSTQYESMNAQFMQRMKIYLQLLANTQQLRSGEMPLREYSEYVINDPYIGIVKTDINSRFLLELYKNWEINNRITFNFLSKELMKRTEESTFLNVCNKGKNIIRNAGSSQFKYAAPFIDKLDHSFTPNCEFQLLHLPHRRAPFVRIRTIRDIQPGERPTLQYGKLNNYQLLIRYGFTVENNPYRLFMLPLNFEHIVDIFNKNIEWKQLQFVSCGIKLKNYVRILPNGSINLQDLKMMRIIFNDKAAPANQDIDSDQFDKLIYKFIGDHAKGLRRNIKINSLKTSSNHSIRVLQDDQIQILDNFVAVNNI